MQFDLKNKTVLITGGAGFIGSNLCDLLLSLGNKVVVLDNFITGRRENLKHLESNTNFKLIEGDICHYEVCADAMKGIDLIFHQAALGSVPRSIENPVLSSQINIMGTVNIFDTAYRANIKRIVYAASSSTYGDSTKLPKEEDKIGKPLSPYAITKYVNELYAENFSRIYDMEIIGLRYFNVFGRRQSPEGAYAAVIPKFIDHILCEESPIINGDGSFSRDFTYIDNVLQANILAATTMNPKAFNSVFNVAFGESTTITELFESLRHEISSYYPEKSKIEPIYGPERKGDIPHSLASIAKAKQLLAYKPTHSLKQGLHETVKWFLNK